METKKSSNILDLLKKYWFVGVIFIALVVFIVIYISNYVETKPVEIETKEEDGKTVIFDVDGNSYFADDFYQSMYDSAGPSIIANKFTEALLDEIYPTTSEMETNATNQAAGIISYYGEDYILSFLQQSGYSADISNLTTYLITSQKSTQLLRDHLMENYDTLVAPKEEEMNAKKVSHILIQLADVQSSIDADGNTVLTPNPTEEETEKLNNVLEALKTQSFEEVAKQYSDDGSAQDGGYLGVYTTSMTQNTFVPQFADAVVASQAGTVTDVITSQYGYHIIKVDAVSKEELLDDEGIINELSADFQDQYTKILLGTAEKKGITYTINDEEVAKQIEEATKDSAEEE